VQNLCVSDSSFSLCHVNPLVIKGVIGFQSQCSLWLEDLETCLCLGPRWMFFFYLEVQALRELHCARVALPNGAERRLETCMIFAKF